MWYVCPCSESCTCLSSISVFFTHIRTRLAAIARRTYLQPGLGVGAFNRIFGGSRKLGFRPGHFHDASGAVNRAAIHALEKLKVLEKAGSGRKVTRDGQKDIDRIAVQVAKAQ